LQTLDAAMDIYAWVERRTSSSEQTPELIKLIVMYKGQAQKRDIRTLDRAT